MKILIFTGAIMLSLSAATQEVQHFSFKDLPGKQVYALLTRSTISGESGTIGYFTYQKGAVVPVHQHANEQYSLITKGSVSVSVGGKDIIVKAGEGIIIPSNVPHGFTALEDGTLDIDFFAPSRMRKSVLFFPTNGLFIGPESSQPLVYQKQQNYFIMSKTIFITGASRGFGKLWAEALLQRGDKVAATSRNISGLQDLTDKYGNNYFTDRLRYYPPRSGHCRSKPSLSAFR